jgi:hypothetical protein
VFSATATRPTDHYRLSAQMNSSHAAHSVQALRKKMQHRPLTWRIFSPRAHKRKTILQLRRLWHCARGAAHRFLSLFKRQNYPSAKLILNKILMRLQRRLHALFATPSAADAYGSIKTESMWKPRRRRARQGHARLPRAPCTPSVCTLFRNSI